jgi:hypothetical protein
MYQIKKLLQKNLELLFWLAALLCLACSQPGIATHFTLCPFKLLGLSWCPGCGIGHAIAFALHGQWAASVRAHWFGIPALGLIFYRVVRLFLNCFVTYWRT